VSQPTADTQLEIEADAETFEAAPPRHYVEAFLALAGGSVWHLPTPETRWARKQAAAYAVRHRAEAIRVHPARVVIEPAGPSAKPVRTVLRQTLDRARPITTRGSSATPLSLQQAEALGYATNSGFAIGAALVMAMATADEAAARRAAGALWDQVLDQAARQRLARHAQARTLGRAALGDAAATAASGTPHVLRVSTGIASDPERRLYLRYARLSASLIDEHAGQAAARGIAYLRGA
jgi:hypothetical protein